MKVLYDFDGSIGWLTLSAPPRNLLRHPVFADSATLASFLAEPALRAVVIRGAGRHFCEGADVAALQAQLSEPEELRAALTQGRALLEQLTFATVPVVAMVRGACLGAGLEIALACHFRLAAESALFGLPEAGLGLMPGLGGTLRAQELAGRATAIELALSGRIVGAEAAQQLGLVDATERTPSLEQATRVFARSLVGDRPPELVRAVMTAIHAARRLPRAEALDLEASLFLDVARRRQPKERS